MSSTDQQAGQPAGTDAEVPAEHAVPADLTLAAEFETATRDQWRELVAGGVRKAGRHELPDPVEDALSRTGGPRGHLAPPYTPPDARGPPTARRGPRPAPVVRRS